MSVLGLTLPKNLLAHPVLRTKATAFVVVPTALASKNKSSLSCFAFVAFSKRPSTTSLGAQSPKHGYHMCTGFPSYGGLVTASLAAALGGTGDLAGAVLLAPALSLEKLKAQPLNAILYPISTQLSAYFPQTPLADKSLNVKFPLLKADDAMDDCTGVYTGKVRARVGHETILATDRLRAQAEDVSTPLLVVHARSDTMCDPEGSAYFVDRASSRDKTFVYAENIDGADGGMWHGLTQEPGSEAVAEHVASWLIAHAGSR